MPSNARKKEVQFSSLILSHLKKCLREGHISVVTHKPGCLLVSVLE
jgi:hypothetical protein